MPMILLMVRFNNVNAKGPGSQLGKGEKAMNARKAKALRRQVALLAEQGVIKTEGYAQRSDTGAIVARGQRGAYQLLKKAVK